MNEEIDEQGLWKRKIRRKIRSRNKIMSKIKIRSRIDPTDPNLDLTLNHLPNLNLHLTLSLLSLLLEL
jgi:hypothetical protein